MACLGVPWRRRCGARPGGAEAMAHRRPCGFSLTAQTAPRTGWGWVQLAATSLHSATEARAFCKPFKGYHVHRSPATTTPMRGEQLGFVSESLAHYPPLPRHQPRSTLRSSLSSQFLSQSLPIDDIVSPIGRYCGDMERGRFPPDHGGLVGRRTGGGSGGQIVTSGSGRPGPSAMPQPSASAGTTTTFVCVTTAAAAQPADSSFETLGTSVWPIRKDGADGQ